MTSFLNKIASSFAGLVLFLVGCVMAGLGLTMIAVLSVFAMVALGIALIASPFVAMIEREDTVEGTAEDVEAAV